MAGVTRLELAASGVTGQRSNQLSYTPSKEERLVAGVFLERNPIRPHVSANLGGSPFPGMDI